MTRTVAAAAAAAAQFARASCWVHLITVCGIT